jgi:hypothetical protein
MSEWIQLTRQADRVAFSVRANAITAFQPYGASDGSGSTMVSVGQAQRLIVLETYDQVRQLLGIVLRPSTVKWRLIEEAPKHVRLEAASWNPLPGDRCCTLRWVFDYVNHDGQLVALVLIQGSPDRKIWLELPNANRPENVAG